MFLGIEIGGTKLQFGVGKADGSAFVALERVEVKPVDGAEGILGQIQRTAAPLIAKHGIQAVGFGFGGPVDVSTGRIIKSHHVVGWDNFALADWCAGVLGLPAAVANDSDMAGLGEARFGAGRSHRIVFYSNVGSGIGGARDWRAGVWRRDRHRLRNRPPPSWSIRSESPPNCRIGGQRLGNRRFGTDRSPFGSGNPARAQVFRRRTDLQNGYLGRGSRQRFGRSHSSSCRANLRLGHCPDDYAPFARDRRYRRWCADGGRNALFEPLRAEVDRYVFPPLRGSYRIAPAELDEEVVVHGSLSLARVKAENGNPNSLFVP